MPASYCIGLGIRTGSLPLLRTAYLTMIIPETVSPLDAQNSNCSKLMVALII